jgi:hypothetical protein
MKRFLLLLTSVVLLVSSVNFLSAQSFVGSDACKNCHSSKFTLWENSGHPFKFTDTQDGGPPAYPPFVTNYEEQWLDSLGDGSHNWSEIAGVIGGWGWKTRFVGADGIIIGTASSSYPDAGMGHNQHNFFGGEDHGWVDYNASTENKYYNYGCFKCHTTGGVTEGSWLVGVADLGNFTEEGIGCESCHGPGSDHAESPSKTNIDRVYEFVHADNSSGGLTIGDEVLTPDPEKDRVNFLCGTCHNRGYADPIDASGGFIRHHEQWEEMVATPHYEAFGDEGCSKCHEPHTRVLWDGDGVTMDCSSCHSDQAAVTNHPGPSNCIECHMPYAAKSGAKRGESGYVGDVRSHLMKIIPDTNSMFTEDGKWVKDDDEREAALSPAYSCLGCHNNDPNDDIPDKTLAEAAAGAKDMHEATFMTEQKDLVLNVYPNPTTGPVNISYTVTFYEEVDIQVFNSSGQLVYENANVGNAPGKQSIVWDRTSNTGVDVKAGYYLVKVSTASISSVQKVVLMN